MTSAFRGLARRHLYVPGHRHAGDGVWQRFGCVRTDFHRRRAVLPLCVVRRRVCARTLVVAGFGAHRGRVRAMRQRCAVASPERSRLAREMHDTLLQGFAGVSLQLDVLRHRLSASGADSAAVGQLDHVLSQVDTCLVDARRSIGDMRALALEQGDLVLALRRVCGQIAQEAGVTVDVTVSGTARRLPAPLETDLLRIGQEALTNAAPVRPRRRPSGSSCASNGAVCGSSCTTTGRGSTQGRWMRAPGAGLGSRACASVPNTSAAALCSGRAPGTGTRHRCKRTGTGAAGMTSPRRIRVLCVDDHEVLRQGLTAVLSTQPDMEVVAEAGDGEAAVEAFQRYRPDVTLDGPAAAEAERIGGDCRHPP